MSLLTKALTLLALALPAAAAAADALPKPVADLGCLIGTWKGKGTFEAGKDRGASGNYTLRYMWKGGGLFGGRSLHLVGLSRG